MRGDVLASGGRSATFGMGNVSQEKWDAIFAPDEDKCPKHPRYQAKRPPTAACAECLAIWEKKGNYIDDSLVVSARKHSDV